MRKDLNMRRGKECAQAAHASSMFLMNLIYDHILDGNEIILSEAEWEWINGNYKKICLIANSEDELLSIYGLAFNAGLKVNLIRDEGLTEFNGPTYTCLAIGPDEDHLIDKITSHLRLY